MNLSDVIRSAQQFAPQFASTYCVVNGEFMTLEALEKMGCDEFLYRSKINMPAKCINIFQTKKLSIKMEIT